MRTALIALIAFAAIGNTAVDAEVPSATCEKLSGSVNRAADASMGFLEGIQAADVSGLVQASTGEFRAAALRTMEARERLIPAMREYAQGLQDLGYQLRVCARR